MAPTVEDPEIGIDLGRIAAGDRILRGKAAARKLGFSYRTFRREVERGNIPPGIWMTEGSVGWRESLLDRVIDDREAGRKVTTI
jgi:predicted DNA-binding transcriptional regulator AlpA